MGKIHPESWENVEVGSSSGALVRELGAFLTSQDGARFLAEIAMVRQAVENAESNKDTEVPSNEVREVA